MIFTLIYEIIIYNKNIFNIFNSIYVKKEVDFLNFNGIAIGFIAFFIIGIFHPIVIKSEYYFGKKIWPVFFILGIIFVIVSLFIKNIFIAIILGIVGFSCFWSINEIIEQEERVKKGWFPKNPNKK